MKTIDLAALRKRARAYGLDPGTAARFRGASSQMGLHSPHDARQHASKALDMSGIQKWVVAVCKPSMAICVGDDLNVLGFRAYCPLGRKIVYRGRQGGNARKRRVHEFAVFGRYLFVGELEEPLQTTLHSGITDVIGDSFGAWPLNPMVVQAINDAELAGKWDQTRPDAVPFKRGDLVRIVDDRSHPFAGFQAIVDSVRDKGVKINVNLFGRTTPMMIPQDKLELA